MKFKFPEYGPEFIAEMDEAGFMLVGNTLGSLESRANFLLEVNGDRKAMGVTYCATQKEIKDSKHKCGAFLKNGLRRFHRIHVLGMSLKAKQT